MKEGLMEQPRLRTPAIIFGMIIAATLFAHTVWNAVFASSSDESGSRISAYRPVRANAPTRITIPAINVDARVQSVGLSWHGTIAVPTNYTDVGWYRLGPAPGEPGSAIIDGHLNNGFALPGVFLHLDRIVPGNDIYIVAASGRRWHFVVTETQTIEYRSPLPEGIGAASGPSKLILVTCDGDWIAREKTYDRRLIVIAALSQ